MRRAREKVGFFPAVFGFACGVTGLQSAGDFSRGRIAVEDRDGLDHYIKRSDYPKARTIYGSGIWKCERPQFLIEDGEPPWQAIKEWIADDEPDLNWFNQERKPAGDDSRRYDQSPAWQPTEIPLGDGLTLVLEVA